MEWGGERVSGVREGGLARPWNAAPASEVASNPNKQGAQSIAQPVCGAVQADIPVCAARCRHN